MIINIKEVIFKASNSAATKNSLTFLFQFIRGEKNYLFNFHTCHFMHEVSKLFFSGTNKKDSISLSPAELAQGVVMVKYMFAYLRTNGTLISQCITAV